MNLKFLQQIDFRAIIYCDVFLVSHSLNKDDFKIVLFHQSHFNKVTKYVRYLCEVKDFVH